MHGGAADSEGRVGVVVTKARNFHGIDIPRRRCCCALAKGTLSFCNIFKTVLKIILRKIGKKMSLDHNQLHRFAQVLDDKRSK